MQTSYLEDPIRVEPRKRERETGNEIENVQLQLQTTDKCESFTWEVQVNWAVAPGRQPPLHKIVGSCRKEGSVWKLGREWGRGGRSWHFSGAEQKTKTSLTWPFSRPPEFDFDENGWCARIVQWSTHNHYNLVIMVLIMSSFFLEP